ncbi:MAG: hypothetical protein WAV76_00045 [Bacteroidota bacterium]
MDRRTLIIPYPDLALDLKYFSLGTTGLRLGSEDDIYGEVSFLNQVPFGSGKGFAHCGVSLKPTKDTRLWLGINSGPYYAAGFAGQFDFPISANHFLYINGRTGNIGGVSEYGFSVGMRVRVY